MLLDVHPLELHFPWQTLKAIRCPLALTNRTDHHVAISITCRDKDTQSSNLLFPQEPSFFKIIEPHSTAVVLMRMEGGLQPPWQYTGKFEVLMVVMGLNEDVVKKLEQTITAGRNLYLKTIKELGGEVHDVHRAMLKAIICDDQASCLAGETHMVRIHIINGFVYILGD